MTSDRWREVTEIFRAAIARDASTRDAFLDEACRHDSSLRSEVDVLVAAHVGAGSFGDRPLALNLHEGKRIAPGMRLGSFRIDAPLGAGGMGEVYRAHDSKLQRDVAIKVLPDSFARDPERLARFEREARLLAALNHPHIGAIYGVEEAEGIQALVLELVDGPTLAERVARGPLTIAAALNIARQIADALDAAHERGIVHRDLKPANIKLTADGAVKVLDFGLAKVITGESGSDAAHTLANSAAATREGMILGTAAYMSPEQARGHIVDKRSDIWAFGCVLYEMLSGRAPFAENTLSDTIAAILGREPDWTALPAGVPSTVERLLRRCLDKDMKRRLRDIGDAELLLDTVPDSATRPPHSGHIFGPVAWVAVVSGCAVSLALGWVLGGRSKPALATVSRWLLDTRPASALLGASPAERTSFGRSRPSRTALALSPDGRTLAFTAQRDGVTRLYVRALDQAEATPIGGTDGADSPFFSPDGHWVGFWAAGAIRKVALSGGPPVKVCDASLPYGSTWSSDDLIFFANANTTIWKVASDGGAPQEVTKRVAGGEARHVLPQVLPGGKWLLFTVLPTVHDWEHTRVVAQALDSGELKVVLEGAADARYIPTGHLVFMRLGNLMAVPFDARRAQVNGAEVGMIEGILQSVNANAVALDTGAGQYAFSSSGTLIYVAGALHPDVEGALQWISRDGSVEPIALPPRPYEAPRLSPDGRHLAVSTGGMRDHDVWRYDFDDGTLARLTTEGRAMGPVWSPDGTQLLFALALTGPFNLFSIRADGGDLRRLGRNSVTQFPGAWTPDGRSVVFTEDPTNWNINLLSVTAPLSAHPLIATRFNEATPEISPDSRWLAYVSDETGRAEVYVRAFPSLGGKRQVSKTGGLNPAWSRNGRKLVFLARPEQPRGDLMQVMEADVTLGTNVTATSPHPLFEPAFAANVVRPYDLTPGAERFIFVRENYPPSTSAPHEMHVVLNWLEELKQRAPAK